VTDRWSDQAQRYLDRDGPPPPEPDEAARADRFLAASGAYAADLRGPGPEVDRAVMAAVRERAVPGRPAGWRWLVESRIQVRPALAVAAALALVIASVAITSLVRAPTVVRPTVGGGGEAGTVLVRFELHAPEARDVALAGSFNGWSGTSNVFVRSPESGLWTVTLALPPGEYVYLFVVDGERWVPDPRAHAQVEDEFGQTNSVLVVGPRGVVRS
jgi:hypothetical protein